MRFLRAAATISSPARRPRSRQPALPSAPPDGKPIAPGRGEMLALLGILFTALLVGKLAPRIGPGVQLLVLGLVAAIVLAELASWQSGATGAGDVLRWLMTGWRCKPWKSWS